MWRGLGRGHTPWGGGCQDVHLPRKKVETQLKVATACY